MSADRLSLKRILPLLFVLASLVSCGGSGFELAPPEWLQGIWQSEVTAEQPAYVKWEFMADNAMYEFHDPDYDIHTTINLLTSFTGKWVRDLNEESEFGTSYTILIDRVQHGFFQGFDDTGAIEDPSVVVYDANTTFSWYEWELNKQ